MCVLAAADNTEYLIYPIIEREREGGGREREREREW